MDRHHATPAALRHQRGHNLKLVLASEGSEQRKVDPDLVALLRKAEQVRQQLFTQAGAAQDRC